jgi:hypothetical protein
MFREGSKTTFLLVTGGRSGPKVGSAIGGYILSALMLMPLNRLDFPKF